MTSPYGIWVRLEQEGQPVQAAAVNFEVYQSTGGLLPSSNLQGVPQSTIQSTTDTQGYAGCQFLAPLQPAYCWIKATTAQVSPVWFLMIVGGGDGAFPSNPSGVDGVDYAEDSDGDGDTDAEELAAGNDPKNPSSHSPDWKHWSLVTHLHHDYDQWYALKSSEWQSNPNDPSTWHWFGFRTSLVQGALYNPDPEDLGTTTKPPVSAYPVLNISTMPPLLSPGWQEGGSAKWTSQNAIPYGIVTDWYTSAGESDGVTDGQLIPSRSWSAQALKVEIKTARARPYDQNWVVLVQQGVTEKQVIEARTLTIPAGSSSTGPMVIYYPPVLEQFNSYSISLLPVELILDNNNIAYKPDSEALGVSNYVTNNELPATSQFNDTNPDPENFRLQARVPNATTNSIVMKLEVKRDGAVVSTSNHTLDKKDGDFVRGKFLRLVTDTNDDAESGDQTILVKLGDKIKVSYDIAAGSKVEQEIQVGRPSSEDNNEADKPWKHDIRKLKLAVHVFKNAAGAPCVTAAQIDQLVDEVNERFAQAGIKAEATKDFGAGNAGFDRPQSLQDGYDGSPSVLSLPTTDERACADLKDGDANTIDVIVVESMNTNGGRGTSFPKARNGTGDAKYDNWMVLSSGVVGNFPNTFPHELMHILLNSAHRGDPATALFKGGTSPNKDVGGTKRIGPYPDATAAGVGQADTTTMRTNTETLP